MLRSTSEVRPGRWPVSLGIGAALVTVSAMVTLILVAFGLKIRPANFPGIAPGTSVGTNFPGSSDSRSLGLNLVLEASGPLGSWLWLCVIGFWADLLLIFACVLVCPVEVLLTRRSKVEL